MGAAGPPGAAVDLPLGCVSNFPGPGHLAKRRSDVQLTKLEKRQFEERGFSRRSFGRLATLLAAGSSLPFYNEPALAQFSKIENAPTDAVMINANENPLGPCPEAREAVANIISQGGRYLYGETDRLAAPAYAPRPISGPGPRPHPEPPVVVAPWPPCAGPVGETRQSGGPRRDPA